MCKSFCRRDYGNLHVHSSVLFVTNKLHNTITDYMHKMYHQEVAPQFQAASYEAEQCQTSLLPLALVLLLARRLARRVHSASAGAPQATFAEPF
jgi:hypothetical protein